MIKTLTLRAALLASTLLASTFPAFVHAQDTQPQASSSDEQTEVTVIGKRVIKGSAGATGLDLSLRETPQSVTVVTAQDMQDFGLNTANSLLKTLPGINVEQVETDRTYYNSRGFDITNFQVDGVGQPLIWGIQYGDIDTAIYDRIEAIRGATGMMTGTGNPSATINYIRKRPTKDFQADVTATYGSWDDKRLEADVSGPLNASGTVEGRLVYATEDKDSWLDYNHVKRNVYYGIVSWDITPKLKLTGGYSEQDNLARGVTWGALPLTYSDGSPITTYKVSATTAAPWTYWNTYDKTAFGELSYAFDNGWTSKVTATHRDYDYQSVLLYAYGNPDKTTGLGLTAYSGIYPASASQSMIDAMATGPFTLFGREHQAVIGVNTATATTLQWESAADTFDYPSFLPSHDVYPAEPAFPSAVLQEDTLTTSSRLYGAVHLNITDRLKGIVGFNAIELKETGFSYGVSQDRSDHAVSPYLGLVYDLTKNVSAYASYSDLFNPQIETDINHKELPAAKGKSYEAGLKSEWFDNRLYATASVFKSEQDDLATFAGYYPNSFDSYYTGVDTYVKGYELEVAGRLTRNWTLDGGWTSLTIKDPTGAEINLYEPRQTLKLETTYLIPQWRELKVGASVRWQSDISTIDQSTTIAQKAYAIAGVMASFRLADHVTASLNVDNLFNQKYWSSLMWNQAFYAAPRSAMVSLSYRY